MALLAVLIVIAFGLLGVYWPKIHAPESTEPLVIPANGVAEITDLNRHLSRLITARTIQNPREIATISETEFASILKTPGPGYTDQTVWYRAAINVIAAPTTKPSRAFIELGMVYLNDIRLSILSRESKKIIWQNRVGDRVETSQGDIRGLSHISEWPVLDAGKYWLIVGVRTNSAHVLHAKLVPEPILIEKSGRDSFIKGACLGILIVAFGLYFTFGTLSRDRSVIWYAGYIFSLLLVYFGITGYAQVIFKPLWPLASDFITGSGTAFALGSSIMMWSYIIRLDQSNPILFRIMYIYSALAIAGFLTGTSNWYILYAKVFFGPQIVLLGVLFVNLIYGGYRQQHPFQTSFFVVALGIPTLGAMAHLMLLMGVLPLNGFTMNILAASSLIQLFMVAIAMAMRTHGLISQRIAALASSQRATQLASEQRTFITMLSHEFRTPLAIIQRSAEILGLHLKAEPEAVLNRLATIQSNAGQLSGLVDAFLTKETLDNATFTTSREAVAIDAFLGDLITRRHREMPGQNISLIRCDVAIVDIDRILMERAFLNLIENARKHAPGAAVWISAERSSNGYVYIRVVDEGPGIAADDLQNVLNAFYRGREATKTQGVGLGLHLTHKIIEAHDGSLSVSVGEDGGTTVLIKLPYDRDKTVLKSNEDRIGFPAGFIRHAKDGGR